MILEHKKRNDVFSHHNGLKSLSSFRLFKQAHEWAKIRDVQLSLASHECPCRSSARQGTANGIPIWESRRVVAYRP